MIKSNRLWVGLVLIAALVVPLFVGAYRLQIFIFAITYSMLALGFRLSWKVGLPRFDVAAWWGVGAYTTAMLMLKAHWSYWATLPISVLVSVAIGYVVFSMSLRRGMMVFMMFGMVFALAVQQVFGTVKFFGGWGGTEALPAITIGSYILSSKMLIYYLGLALLIVNIGVYLLLYKSKIGRAWDAIGSGLRLANSLGVDVVRYRMANVLIGNAFLALAGSFSVMYQAMVVPSSYGFGRSINVIIYVLLGGLGFSLAGPVLGAFVLTALSEALRAFEEYEVIITGLLTILIIMFAPTGVLGVLDKRVKPMFSRWKRSPAKPSEPPPGELPVSEGSGQS